MYADDIDRMALVGDKAWEKTWSGIFGLFFHTQTRYFDRSEIETAWEWIHDRRK
jgi:SpoIIAA-like